MKTKLIFLVLLMACFSCETGKTVSDAEKEKIKGEVKEVINVLYKAAEEVNLKMVITNWQNSPDFIYTYNGISMGYNECVEWMNPLIATLSKQKCTIVEEKFAVLDNSTVIYTSSTTWLMDFKDGHSVLQDPWFIQTVFKKTDGKWKIVTNSESGVEKNVIGESANGLNQTELLKKFIGNWEGPAGDETTQFVQFKNLQGNNILILYTKVISQGKIVLEGTGFWGYDEAKKIIDHSVMLSTGSVFHYTGGFTSPTKLELTDDNNANNKFIFEFISPNEFEETKIANDKTKTRIVKRIK